MPERVASQNGGEELPYYRKRARKLLPLMQGMNGPSLVGKGWGKGKKERS